MLGKFLLHGFIYLLINKCLQTRHLFLGGVELLLTLFLLLEGPLIKVILFLKLFLKVLDEFLGGL
jgi:hypothetical protein